MAFYGETELAALKDCVDKLAQGDYEQRKHSMITWDDFSRSARAGQNAHFDNKHDVEDRLKAVTEEQLKPWLQGEMLSPIGVHMLTGRLLSLYQGSMSLQIAGSRAALLLGSSLSRAAKGIIRADLYSNWRRANRGSIRKDLVPDIYHVLNACYCSIYATAERGQMAYAALLLSDSTKTAVCGDQTPVEAWLLGLV
jgi:hypothetical protein